MLTPHDAMRLLEEGGVGGSTAYNWKEELIKSMQAAYAAGLKDMQERCAKVCIEAANRIWLSEDRSADVTDFLDAIRLLE